MDNTLEKNQKLSFGTKLGYAMGSFGENIGFNLFYTFFLLFLTNYAGVNPAVAGTIALVAVLWDAVIGMLAGYLSDKSTNPKGKRRPFLSRFAIPFGIMCCLLFTNLGFSGAAQVVYFIILNILFWFFFELTDVPYLTLGGEITDNPDEKTSLRSFCTVLNYAGFLIAASFTLQFVNYFQKIFLDANKAWTATCGVFGLLIALSYFIVVLSTKGKEKTAVTTVDDQQTSGEGFKDTIIKSLKVKPYRNLWFYNAVFNWAIFSCTSLIVYMIYYVCGGNDDNVSIIMAAYAVMTMVLSPIVGKVASKTGNRMVLFASVIIVGGGFALFYVIPLNLSTIYVMQLLVAIGMSSYFVISYSMLYEVCEVSSLKTGSKTDGILVAFYQFAQKLGGALGMWMAGMLLSFFKYDPANVTDHAVHGIRLSATLIPGIIILVSLIFIVTYGLKPDRLKKLRALAEKSELTKEDSEFVNSVL